MKSFTLCLVLGMAACGPALAQSHTAVRVSPALGLDDFRQPQACATENICATVAPALAGPESPVQSPRAMAIVRIPIMPVKPTPPPAAPAPNV